MSIRILTKYPTFYMRFIFNIWPPALGAGIRVLRVSSDVKFVKIGLKLRFYNRNSFGTHFGGNLYSMTDPFYAIMLTHHIGKEHIVWDKSATIEFVKPGKSTVTAQFELTDEVINGIVERAKSGQPVIETFHVDVVDSDQNTIARVQKKIYIRKRAIRP